MPGPTGDVVGFVQAGRGRDVAWLIGIDWQRVGYAREATDALCERLIAVGVTVHAHIHPEHDALWVPEIRSWLVTWGFAVARSGVEAHAFEPGSCHNRAIEATRKLRKAA